MPPVFNRVSPTHHNYDAALAEWLRVDAEHASMARNIQYDHRVSPKREIQFDRYVTSPCDASGLRRAIDSYFDGEIRSRRVPAFFDDATNGQNIVHGGLLNKRAFDEDLRLVTTLDLNRLGREYQKAKIAGWPEFVNFPSAGGDAERLAWLDEKLEGKTDAERRLFVGRVLERLTESRMTEAFQPVWVTFWTKYEPFFAQGPDCWCEVVGVPKTTDAVWIVALTYTVSEAGTLVCPTQLDAGWFACHFPSPVPRLIGEGGCPMSLRLSPVSNDLLPEFIHEQIDFLPRHVQGIGRTSRRTTGRLFDSRTHHRSLLDRFYMGLSTWMPQPV